MSTTLLGSAQSMALMLRAFLLRILHLPCSLFQLSLPQSTALIAASPPRITTAPPNAQDELHTFPNQHAGLLSPTLHPTAGQEQALPFPTPPAADILLAPAEGGRNTLGQEENICFGTKVLKIIGNGTLCLWALSAGLDMGSAEVSASLCNMCFKRTGSCCI